MRFLDDDLSSDPLRRRLRRQSRAEITEEATAFLRAFYREHGGGEQNADARIRDVRRSLLRTGFYQHTPDELAFGARVAWRNHARCIGRLYWKSLEVFDCREIKHPDAIAAQVMDHMRLASAQGKIRSIISIFAPIEGSSLPAYIESAQVAQYAGYSADGGGILGDPQNLEFTRVATTMGWTPPATRGPFDLLPLMIRDQDGRRSLYEVSNCVIDEVAITHPNCQALSALGLRWYAVPCVCDMILTIGGIDYPCAPFNGHYMATEIASRNLVDTYRYDLLSTVGEAFGMSKSDPFWRDAALLELNRAVLHSFQAHGAAIIDHHTASEQFVSFMTQESAAGRFPSANWSWIVPPQASAACPVFHRDLQDTHDVPNFYRSRASDGKELRVSRLSEQRTVLDERVNRVRRRWRDWRRTRVV